jgi:hypothetical protein
MAAVGRSWVFLIQSFYSDKAQQARFSISILPA